MSFHETDYSGFALLDLDINGGASTMLRTIMPSMTRADVQNRDSPQRLFHHRLLR
jgi:hypothetical protein